MPTIDGLESIYLGPGVLKIGATGSEIDASCLVNNAKITVDKSEDDARVMLCGTSKPGKVTYTYALEGNVDTDIDAADGLFALCADNPGTQQAFTFTPNTDVGTTATGTLVIDPLEFGADANGDPLQSDFTFTIVGKPTYAYGPATPLGEASPAADTAGDGQLVGA